MEPSHILVPCNLFWQHSIYSKLSISIVELIAVMALSIYKG